MKKKPGETKVTGAFGLQIQIRRPVASRMTLTICGSEGSTLIHHAWDPKTRKEMAEKGQTDEEGQPKTRKKKLPPRDIEAEYQACFYRRSDGTACLPAASLRKACAAATAFLDVQKSVVLGAIFFYAEDGSSLIPIEFDELVRREDSVNIGKWPNRVAQTRYRPEFHGWRARVVVEYDAELLNEQSVIALIERAGFSVGIGEWRPEKSGQAGRFHVDEKEDIKMLVPRKKGRAA